MSGLRTTLIFCLLIAACSQQPALEIADGSFGGPIPVDFSGSWERDYSRGDDIDTTLRYMYRQMTRAMADPNTSRRGPPMPSVSQRDVDSIVALARMAEMITRPDVLTISQDEYQIVVAREDDFSMTCEFYDGVAKSTASDYGTEVCGWSGLQLVSNLILPDGLLVTHRFAISPNGHNLHVRTTVSSSTSRNPFTVNRYYMKFDPPESKFNCIETLSMKRVCSTGEINP